MLLGQMCAHVPYIPPPYRTGDQTTSWGDLGMTLWAVYCLLPSVSRSESLETLPAAGALGWRMWTGTHPLLDLRATPVVGEKGLCVGKEVSPGWESVFGGLSLHCEISSWEPRSLYTEDKVTEPAERVPVNTGSCLPVEGAVALVA